MESEAIQLTEEHQQTLETVGELVQEGSLMRVGNADSHTAASDFLVRVQTKKRELEDIREFQLEPIKAAKRKIELARKRCIAFFERPLGLLEQMRGKVDRSMVAWRREERRKAELEAQKKRAVEQKKVEEQRRKQERVAEKLDKKGLAEEAAEIRDRAEAAPAPAPVEPRRTILFAPGANVKIKKLAEVNEPLQNAMLQAAINAYNAQSPALVEKLVPAAYWTLNRKALDAFGQKTDGQVQVAGVKWVEDESTAARRRR